MTLLALIQILQQLARDHGKRIVSLREVSVFSGDSLPATGMTLLRAERKGVVSRVGGLWINRMDPPSLTEVALALFSPSYISFESALYHHHILSQSPRGAMTVATRKRPAVVETPLGNIRFVYLKPPLFFGYDSQRMAYPEKAWLDLLYIRGLGGRKDLFTEKFYPEQLDKNRLRKFQKRFPLWVTKLNAETQLG